MGGGNRAFALPEAIIHHVKNTRIQCKFRGQRPVNHRRRVSGLNTQGRWGGLLVGSFAAYLMGHEFFVLQVKFLLE